MRTSLVRSLRVLPALLQRTIQLYVRTFRLLVGVAACLVIPWTCVLMLTGFAPTLYPTLAMVQSACVQFLIALALVPAIAAAQHNQPMTIAGAYQHGLFRGGVTAVAGGLLAFLLLVPGVLLLDGVVDPQTLHLLAPVDMLRVFRLLGGIGLAIMYCIVSFLLFPVAVLNRGGPGSVMSRVIMLTLRHGWFIFLLFLISAIITTLLATIPEYFIRWGWAATMHRVLLPLGATRNWIEWVVFITIQQLLLLLTVPVPSIISTMWYIDVRTAAT